MAVPLWEANAVRTPAGPRAVAAVGALIAGFIVARHWHAAPSTVWLLAAAGLGLLTVSAGPRLARLTLLLAVFAFGAGWFTLRIHEPPRDSLAVLLAHHEEHPGPIITVEGIILNAPRILPPLRDILNPYASRSARTRFDVRVHTLHSEIGSRPASGIVSVRIGEPLESAAPHPRPTGPAVERPLRAGDVVTITGVYMHLEPPMNPGQPDRRLWAAQDGRAGTLHLPSAALIEPAAHSRGTVGTVHSMLLATRGWLSTRAHTLLLGDQAAEQDRGHALLGALILGEQEPALREVRSAFTRLGLAHVLCISGFHLAMLAAVGMFALRLGGDIGRWEPMLIAALLTVYLTVLPFQAPVWRAAMMVLALLLADALGRRYDRIAVVAWIAAAMLIWRPMDAWAIGFQLSFGLVATLIWLGGPLHQRIWGLRLMGVVRPDPGLRGMVADWFKQLFTANLLCWGVSWPVIAFHTGLVSPLAVIAGVITVPAIMVVLIGGYAVVLLGVLIPAASDLVRTCVEWLAGITAAGVTWMDAVPGSSLRLPTISLLLTIAATLLMLYWFWRGHLRDRAAWTATIAIAVWLAIEVGPGAGLPRHVALRIDALSVGDGTCMLLRSGREALLWDCGSLRPGVGQILVPRAVRALGAHRVPTVIVTHAHLDHYNALLDIAEPLGVRTVILTERFMQNAEERPGGPEAFVLLGLEARGIEVKVFTAGATLTLGDTTLEFISPPPGATWVLENDQSLAAIVTPTLREGAPARRLLLTGDMERQALEHTMRHFPNLTADIMEAPHHGSAREPAFEFVSRINPLVVLQSTGPRRVGDERWATIRRERLWHKTAEHGASWAIIRRDGTITSGRFR